MTPETPDIRRFRCEKCGKTIIRNFTANPWAKKDIDKDGSYESICSQTNKVEKCREIK